MFSIGIRPLLCKVFREAWLCLLRRMAGATVSGFIGCVEGGEVLYTFEPITNLDARLSSTTLCSHANPLSDRKVAVCVI